MQMIATHFAIGSARTGSCCEHESFSEVSIVKCVGAHDMRLYGTVDRRKLSERAGFILASHLGNDLIRDFFYEITKFWRWYRSWLKFSVMGKQQAITTLLYKPFYINAKTPKSPFIHI